MLCPLVMPTTRSGGGVEATVRVLVLGPVGGCVHDATCKTPCCTATPPR